MMGVHTHRNTSVICGFCAKWIWLDGIDDLAGVCVKFYRLNIDDVAELCRIRTSNSTVTCRNCHPKLLLVLNVAAFSIADINSRDAKFANCRRCFKFSEKPFKAQKHHIIHTAFSIVVVAAQHTSSTTLHQQRNDDGRAYKFHFIYFSVDNTQHTHTHTFLYLILLCHYYYYYPHQTTKMKKKHRKNATSYKFFF